MLQFIGSKVPHYLYGDIVNDTSSIEDVWSLVRSYYNFVQSEANFLDYFDLRQEPGERPERFYRRLRAAVMDSKLRPNGLTHNGKPLTAEEKLCPTAERLIVGRWLELLHPGLRALVKRHFATDLGKMSIKDLQPCWRPFVRNQSVLSSQWILSMTLLTQRLIADISLISIRIGGHVTAAT